jgi:hypothetical protein
MSALVGLWMKTLAKYVSALVVKKNVGTLILSIDLTDEDGSHKKSATRYKNLLEN